MLAYAGRQAVAQEVIPLSNPITTTLGQAAASSAPSEPLEVEIIEVRRLMAIPNAIERPASKFILVLVNKSPDTMQSFQIDPGSVADAVLGSNPLLKLDGSVAPLQKHRMAFVVNLPAGEFHLKSATTATTLCTITGK